MVHSAILGRRFNWPTINLGFSGQGKMDPEMTDLLAGAQPSVYVLDCLPNLVADEIKERVEPCVRKLRAAHPDTPIVLVEDRTMQDSFLIAGRMECSHLKDRAELKAACERLKKSGVKNLYYIPGEHLFGDDGEGSVDGSHPSDLGFMRQADIFAKVLGPLLTPGNNMTSSGLSVEPTMPAAPPDGGRTYRGPFAIMTILFFMWGFITSVNDMLIPRFKEAFGLDYFQAMLVQFAFFGAYFFGSLLYFLISARIGDPIARIGYKNGVVSGLLLATLGTALIGWELPFTSIL